MPKINRRKRSFEHVDLMEQWQGILLRNMNEIGVRHLNSNFSASTQKSNVQKLRPARKSFDVARTVKLSHSDPQSSEPFGASSSNPRRQGRSLRTKHGERKRPQSWLHTRVILHMSRSQRSADVAKSKLVQTHKKISKYRDSACYTVPCQFCKEPAVPDEKRLASRVSAQSRLGNRNDSRTTNASASVRTQTPRRPGRRHSIPLHDL